MEFEGEQKEALIKSSRSFRAYLQKVYQFDINTRERLEFIGMNVHRRDKQPELNSRLMDALASGAMGYLSFWQQPFVQAAFDPLSFQFVPSNARDQNMLEDGLMNVYDMMILLGNDQDRQGSDSMKYWGLAAQSSLGGQQSRGPHGRKRHGGNSPGNAVIRSVRRRRMNLPLIALMYCMRKISGNQHTDNVDWAAMLLAFRSLLRRLQDPRGKACLCHHE